MAVGDILDREERPAMIRFEKRSIEDKLASREAGQIVYKDVDFVLVTPPYSKDIVEHKVERWFEQVDKNVRNGKVPREHRDYWHKCYEKFKRDEAMPLNGTSIKNWPAITPAQTATCLAANIHTIEDLAAVNDQGIRRLGMGAMELKNKAKAYVQAAKDTGPLVMENAALKRENEILTATVENLRSKLEDVSNRFEAVTSHPITEVHSDITADDLRIDFEPPVIEKPVEMTLAEKYEQKFGKKPHHRMKEETIKKQLGL